MSYLLGHGPDAPHRPAFFTPIAAGATHPRVAPRPPHVAEGGAPVFGQRAVAEPALCGLCAGALNMSLSPGRRRSWRGRGLLRQWWPRVPPPAAGRLRCRPSGCGAGAGAPRVGAMRPAPRTIGVAGGAARLWEWPPPVAGGVARRRRVLVVEPKRDTNATLEHTTSNAAATEATWMQRASRARDVSRSRPGVMGRGMSPGGPTVHKTAVVGPRDHRAGPGPPRHAVGQ